MTTVKDVDYMLMSEMNDRDLLNFCKTNKYSSEICRNENFWKKRTFVNYGEVEKNPDRTWKDFYINIIYYDNKLKDDDELKSFGGKFDHGSSLIEVSRKGIKNKDLIDFYINKGVEKYYLNAAMQEAVKINDLKLVKYLISKGADEWNGGMTTGAEVGNLRMIRFFVKNNPGTKNWNLGLKYSAEAGQLKAAEYFIEKGANNLTEALDEALEGKEYEMANYLKKVMKYKKWHYSRISTKEYFFI